MPSFNSDLYPDATGRNLGLEDARWDAWIRNLNVTGTVTGNFSALAIHQLSRVVVPFDPNPIFEAGNYGSFEMTLTGNVVSSLVRNPRPGQLIIFKFIQDAIGGHDMTWPTNVHGGMQLGTGPNEISVQAFHSDGINIDAIAPGVIA